MSEEEIIKEIEIIKETQDIMQHNLDIYPPKEDIYKLDTKQLKAVICLLDLYNKEKEKNKELKEELDRQINTREIEEDFIEKKCWVEFDEKGNMKLINYISKDKIREIANNYRLCKVVELKYFYKEILELLEERN